MTPNKIIGEFISCRAPGSYFASKVDLEFGYLLGGYYDYEFDEENIYYINSQHVLWYDLNANANGRAISKHLTKED